MPLGPEDAPDQPVEHGRGVCSVDLWEPSGARGGSYLLQGSRVLCDGRYADFMHFEYAAYERFDAFVLKLCAGGPGRERLLRRMAPLR